jgi:hypothetical protein
MAYAVSHRGRCLLLRVIHMGFMVDKVAMRQAFLRAPQFSPTNYQSINLHSLISALVNTAHMRLEKVTLPTQH